jgi:hypothetical protein
VQLVQKGAKAKRCKGQESRVKVRAFAKLWSLEVVCVRDENDQAGPTSRARE